MVTENLLATYSLLAFINDNQTIDKNKSILQLFIPIVQESINRMLRAKGTGVIMGKSTLEIRESIKDEFDLEMPPVALDSILQMMSENGDDARFTLNRDKSFIIKSGYGDQIDIEYQKQKEQIRNLAKNYKSFCKREDVRFDFAELVTFIQDQKNRIFYDSQTAITGQDYYVSKYVSERIKRKDYFYHIICSVYLGGVISSYLSFQITERVMAVELLIDTNFYISLCNLNTEESYETCKQLFDTARFIGFRFSILQRTIEQIKILISNRVKGFDVRESKAAWDLSDIHAACVRRSLTSSELALYKDNILSDLSNKGINVVYDANIKSLVDDANKSPELRALKHLRGNYESALNDIIAAKYVEKKRSAKKIAEFSDVNCWFLTNSTSFNKHELNIPVWQRNSINASDLLLLLWYANPSLEVKNLRSMLAITSLSANVLKFRSEKCPPAKLVDEIQNKISRLQYSGQVTQEAIAKLCIRMSEGCIDENEAERLVMMPTSEFVEYVEKIRTSEQAYMDITEENEDLTEENMNLKKANVNNKLIIKMQDMRLASIAYVFFAVVIYLIYWFFIYKNHFMSVWIDFIIQAVYWVITCVLMNLINHGYIYQGLKSFFCKDSVIDWLARNTK